MKMNSAEWDHDKLLALIDLYRSKPELWDCNNKFYHCKNKKHESWIEITEHFDVDVESIKKKMNSLLSSFRREKARGIKVNGHGEVYESTWFAFKKFSFLLDKRRPTRGNPDIAGCLDTTETDMADDVSSDGDDMENGHETITPITEIKEDPLPYFLTVNDHFMGPRSKRSRTDRRKKPWDNPRNALRNSKNVCDSSDLFGEYLGMKLKTYNKRTRSIVQHLISNVIFEADMGKYDNEDSSYYHSIPCVPSDVQDLSPCPSPNAHPSTSNDFSPHELPTQSPNLSMLKIDADEACVNL